MPLAADPSPLPAPDLANLVRYKFFSATAVLREPQAVQHGFLSNDWHDRAETGRVSAESSDKIYRLSGRCESQNHVQTERGIIQGEEASYA